MKIAIIAKAGNVKAIASNREALLYKFVDAVALFKHLGFSEPKGHTMELMVNKSVFKLKVESNGWIPRVDRKLSLSLHLTGIKSKGFEKYIDADEMMLAIRPETTPREVMNFIMVCEKSVLYAVKERSTEIAELSMERDGVRSGERGYKAELKRRLETATEQTSKQLGNTKELRQAATDSKTIASAVFKINKYVNAING